MLKKTFIGLLTLFIVAQFIRPKKHSAVSPDVVFKTTTNTLGIDKELGELLEVACYDCHSNATRYPWYSQITPVNFWLEDHIVEGKGHFNFSELNNYTAKKRNHKLEEVVTEVEKHKMPLNSYTWIHKDAKLTDVQRNLIVNWAKQEMARVY